MLALSFQPAFACHHLFENCLKLEALIIVILQLLLILLWGHITDFTKIMNVTYGTVRLSSARTRWGSCSARGNLNFHWKLILMPPEVLDYVVVHELAHRREMNHSPRFWAIVEKVLPDYKERRRWLKENGATV